MAEDQSHGFGTRHNPDAAVDDDDEFGVGGHYSPGRCEHPSSDGIDQTPIGDPAKVWRCHSCGAEHLSDGTRVLDPKVIAVFDEFWAELVTRRDGTLNVDQVKAELYDAHHMITEVPKIFDEITGGLMSKPNYTAQAVIAVHEENCPLKTAIIDEIRETLSYADTGEEQLAALAEVLENNDTLRSSDREEQRQAAGDGVKIGPLTAEASWVGAMILNVITETYPMIYTVPAALKTLGDGRLDRILLERAWFEARSPDGDLIGVSAVHLTDPSGAVAYISSTFVARRGHGIGKALTQACLAWAVERSCSRAVATTNPWNTASIANLTRLGFSETGRSPDSWLNGDDVIEYTLDLPRQAP